MRQTARYSSVEVEEYDLDHVITQANDETLVFIAKLKAESKSDADFKAVLKAITTTMIDQL
jgi:hypothetical protein